jgi:hypothetical protein
MTNGGSPKTSKHETGDVNPTDAQPKASQESKSNTVKSDENSPKAQKD